jgi:glyoxylase-like metal-dependent hydrolase (beta-lactamase superfamily II)
MALRVHHLNCATLRPPMAGLTEAGRMVCHCLLIETGAGLVLVDTGFGTGDVTRPEETLHPLVRQNLTPDLLLHETAFAQVEALGFATSDVRHIVLTHLDCDHAGGLRDFPAAAVHVSAAGYAAMQKPPTPEVAARYVARQWEHGPEWVVEPAGGDEWFGLAGVRPLTGLDELLLVPLDGHLTGHSGVAVPRADGRWLLHAGDAAFHRGRIAPEHAPCPPLTEPMERGGATDEKEYAATIERLTALHRDHADRVEIVLAHDTRQYDGLAAG